MQHYTSAVFNMTTQFGGGKTHALTMLYHLAKLGSAANGWRGVSNILDRAGIKSVPNKCAIAIFVGTEFDSVSVVTAASSKVCPSCSNIAARNMGSSSGAVPSVIMGSRCAPLYPA